MSPEDAAKAAPLIDRHALVSRHDIQWNDLEGVIPLGNGEFCFGADGTGLQTFCGNTMSHWAWHSFPLPEGFSPADVPATGNPDRGRVAGPMRVPEGKEPLFEWMTRNPHPLNLCRLRLVRADGAALKPEAVSGLRRRLDLWTGLHTSDFQVDGVSVRVQTCVHPALDAGGFRLRLPHARHQSLRPARTGGAGHQGRQDRRRRRPQEVSGSFTPGVPLRRHPVLTSRKDSWNSAF